MSPMIGCFLAELGSRRILYPSLHSLVGTAGVVGAVMPSILSGGIVWWAPAPGAFPERSTPLPGTVNLPARSPVFWGVQRGAGVWRGGRYK